LIEIGGVFATNPRLINAVSYNRDTITEIINGFIESLDNCYYRGELFENLIEMELDDTDEETYDVEVGEPLLGEAYCLLFRIYDFLYVNNYNVDGVVFAGWEVGQNQD